VDRKLPYCSAKCEKEITGYAPQTLRKKERDSLFGQVQATTAWRPCDLDGILQITAPLVGVISDLHAPLHSGLWLMKAIETFKHFGVKHILLNGDNVDANQISRHAGQYFNRRSNLEDDLDAFEAVLKMLCEHFDAIYIDAGNHDMRLVHKFGGEVSYKRMMQMIYSDPKIKVTSRSFCFVNDSVEVIHPRQYSKIRGKLPSDLATRWQKSILTGHQHHSAMTISQCGKFQACDVGTLADVELQDYIRNERNTYAEPMNGFAIIFGNRIQCFDKFTLWELFGLPPL